MLRINAGEFKGRKIQTPEGMDTRPTTDKTRAALFSSLGGMFDGGIFFDLFAGSGAVGLEALSRGMDRVLFAENSKKAMEVLKTNIRTLRVEERCLLHFGNWQEALKKTEEKADVIFLDPPYDLAVYEKCLKILPAHMKEDGWLVLESRKEKELPEETNELKKEKERTYGISKLTYYRRKRV